MKATIKDPCSEDWNSMRIGLKSRFCSSCSKNVMDFTNMKREEILAYLLENRNQQTCGRIYNKQLDFSTEDYIVTINSLSSKHKNSNLSFYLLTIGTLILSGTVQAQSNQKPTTEIIYQQPSGNPATLKQEKEFKATKDSVEKKIEIIDEITLGIIVQGDIAVEPIPTEEINELEYTRHFAEKMPEFVGGIDSMMRFLHQHITYPKWEKENQISGTVYVRITIDTTGKVTSPYIIKTVPDSKNFNQEVINAVLKMPNWIPGEEQGKKVPVYFNIPVRFSNRYD